MDGFAAILCGGTKHTCQDFTIVSVTACVSRLFANSSVRLSESRRCDDREILVGAGLEIIIFFQGAQLHLQIFKSYLKMFCIETSSSLGSLQKFEGAAGEFKGALGSPHPLISSPVVYQDWLSTEAS